jgi:hypothetical protein
MKDMSTQREDLLERFKEIRDDLDKSQDDFENRSEIDELAQILLTYSNDLIAALKHLEDDYLDYINDKNKYQILWLRKGLFNLRSIFVLVRNQLYDLATRDIRFHLENYLIIKRMNKDKEEAERVYKELKTEIEETEADPFGMKVPETSIGNLSDLRKEEKRKLKDKSDRYGKLYNLLSNKSSHPHMILGALNDGVEKPEEKREILGMAVWFLMGYIFETYRLSESKEPQEFVEGNFREKIEFIKKQFPEGMPTFIEPTF